MTSNEKSHWGFKKKEEKKETLSQNSKVPFFFENAWTESPSARLNDFQLLGNTKWPLLQGRPASSCTYHAVESHPVPGRHVTFKNAKVNDSTVHNGAPKWEGRRPIYFIILLPAVFFFQSYTPSFLCIYTSDYRPPFFFLACVSPKGHLWWYMHAINIDAFDARVHTLLLGHFACAKSQENPSQTACLGTMENLLNKRSVFVFFVFFFGHFPSCNVTYNYKNFRVFKSNICVKCSEWQQRQHLTFEAPLKGKPYRKKLTREANKHTLHWSRKT